MSSFLEQRIADIKPGDYICSIYVDPAEQRTVTTAFLKTGLARGHRCIHAADNQALGEVRRALAAAGVDVGREQERGGPRDQRRGPIPPGADGSAGRGLRG